eukprot:400778-Hanusia_phi.AAC.1
MSLPASDCASAKTDSPAETVRLSPTIRSTGTAKSCGWKENVRSSIGSILVWSFSLIVSYHLTVRSALMEQLRIATSVADERLAELQEAEGELEVCKGRRCTSVLSRSQECKIALSSANQRIEELEYALWVEHCPGASREDEIAT